MRDLILGIKNLIRWFPIVWNDRDWDFHYMMLFIKKKLEITQSRYEKHESVVINHEEDMMASQIAYTLKAYHEWDNSEDWIDEEKAWIDFWDSIKEYGMGWWD
jgi:hypothetical protein